MQLFDAKIINKIQVIGPLGKKIHKAGVQYYFMTTLFKLLDMHMGNKGWDSKHCYFYMCFAWLGKNYFFLCFPLEKKGNRKTEKENCQSISPLRQLL